MPSRIIREGWLESEPINSLSKDAEIFFLRLCLKADDFGRFHANPVLLKSNLYPLKEAIRSTDIPRWLAECEKAGLVRCYEHSGKRYLEIPKFGQRTRAESSKFPEPSEGKILPAGDCPALVGQLSGDCQSGAHGVGVGVGVGVDSRAAQPPRQTALSDVEWRRELQQSEAYINVNVEVEFRKMVFWCQQKGKKPSRARFLNWLNKCEQPMKVSGPTQPSLPEFRAPRRGE